MQNGEDKRLRLENIEFIHLKIGDKCLYLQNRNPPLITDTSLTKGAEQFTRGFQYSTAKSSYIEPLWGFFYGMYSFLM